eukprot:gene5586-biopygen19259
MGKWRTWESETVRSNEREMEREETGRVGKRRDALRSPQSKGRAWHSPGKCGRQNIITYQIPPAPAARLLLGEQGQHANDTGGGSVVILPPPPPLQQAPRRGAHAVQLLCQLPQRRGDGEPRHPHPFHLVLHPPPHAAAPVQGGEHFTEYSGGGGLLSSGNKDAHSYTSGCMEPLEHVQRPTLRASPWMDSEQLGRATTTKLLATHPWGSSQD